MKIKTSYYYAVNGKYQGSKDLMVLKDRQIICLGNQAHDDKKRPFYYDDTDYAIKYELRNERKTVVINKLISEDNAGDSQQKYLAKLTWMQQQKLLWMFNRHWLQQPKLVLQWFVAGVLMTLAFIYYHVVN